MRQLPTEMRLVEQALLAGIGLCGASKKPVNIALIKF